MKGYQRFTAQCNRRWGISVYLTELLQKILPEKRCTLALQACETNGTSSMTCLLPPLNLPPEFARSNDTKRDGLAAATVKSIYGNATANVYIGFSLDGVNKYANTSKSLPYINFTLVQIDVSFNCSSQTPIVYNPGDGRPISIKVCFLICRIKPIFSQICKSLDEYSFRQQSKTIHILLGCCNWRQAIEWIFW